MKIAIVGPYPLDTQRLSGVEVAIIYVQRELVRMPGIALHVVTCNPTLDAPRTVTLDGVPITYLPRHGLGRLTGHAREERAIGAALRAIQPDIVHAHGSGLYAGAALASGLPTVLTVHGIAAKESELLSGWNHRLRGWLDARYERRVVARAEHMMLITPYVEQVFAGVFRGRSYLVENACDDAFFALERQPVAGRVFFAGPVLARKGILPLLKALALVRDHVPGVQLRIAGSTTIDLAYYAECAAYVQAAGLSVNVAFLGHLAQAAVLEEYRTCALFVLPSFQETAPMVIEQAMAAGVPSIATRAGGVPWMIDEGVTGLSLPVPATLAGEPEPLAAALVRLLTDGDLAQRMGAAAKAQAEARFRPSAVAQRTVEVYEQVLTGRAR
ncbi:MAG: glycosyltransferase family 4 protein [Chloroflexota bacterium]